jgi:hypothetical protein
MPAEPPRGFKSTEEMSPAEHDADMHGQKVETAEFIESSSRGRSRRGRGVQ